MKTALCVQACTCVLECVHTHVEEKQDSLRCPFFGACLLRWDLCSGLAFTPSRPDWLASEHQGSGRLHLPSLG